MKAHQRCWYQIKIWKTNQPYIQTHKLYASSSNRTRKKRFKTMTIWFNCIWQLEINWIQALPFSHTVIIFLPLLPCKYVFRKRWYSASSADVLLLGYTNRVHVNGWNLETRRSYTAASSSKYSVYSVIGPIQSNCDSKGTNQWISYKWNAVDKNNINNRISSKRYNLSIDLQISHTTYFGKP